MKQHRAPLARNNERTWSRAFRVLVTGGGRGLGREFTIAVVAAGGHALAVGRDHDSLAATRELARELPGRLECFQTDLTQPGSFRAALQYAECAFGGVDVLVNNAGVPGPLGPMWTVDPQEWRRTVEVNLVASHHTIHEVLPAMIARGFGRVVNVVSRAGRERWPNASAYAVSKASLIALTSNLGTELLGSGVSAVAFDPGLIDIGITRAHLDRGHIGDPHADQVLDFALRARSNGGFTALSDALSAFTRILSGEADHRSGQYLTVADLLNL